MTTDATPAQPTARRTTAGDRRAAPYDRAVPRKAARSKSRTGDEAKSSRTRERILDAAAHVLSKKGYSGTRLGDIAEQAQLQAPAIYYYWPSREALIEEVMWVGIQRLHQYVTETLERLPADTPPMDRISTAIEAHLQVALELSDFATAIIRNSGQIPEEIRTRQGSEDAKYGTLWRGLIRDADTAGEIRADLDRRTAQRLVIGALNWAAEWWDPERDSISVTVNTAQSLVRHGLSSRSRLTAAAPEGSEPRP